MSIRRSIFLGALAAPLVILACGPDPFPTEYLGVPDGGPAFAAPSSQQPQKVGLAPADGGLETACDGLSPFVLTVPAAAAFGGLATADAHVVMSLGGRGYTFATTERPLFKQPPSARWPIRGSGCPSVAAAGPYQSDLGAVAYDGAVVWAASGSSVLALSPSGALLATCPGAATGLASDPDTGNAYAIDGSVLRVLTVASGQCGVLVPTLAPEVGADLRAVAPSATFPGTVWLATTPGGVPRVTRVDGTSGACAVKDGAGNPCGGASLAPACSVSSVLELGGRLVVVDPTCGRTWFFPLVDPVLQLGTPISVASAPGVQPVAVAASPTVPDEVLVAERAGTSPSSSVVQLSRVKLP